jgi:hypothetical protein
MQGTSRIYEEPSRLSQGLVIGLSIAVVLMAGRLTVTVLSSNAATTATEADTDAMASKPAPAYGALVSGAPDEPRQTETAHSNSVHFDWPEEFSSPTPTPQRTALPLAPELPTTRDLGRSPWPVATTMPDARSRGLAARQPAAAVPEATDAIVGVLAPRQHGAAGRETTAAAGPPPRPAPPRRQKPRVESDAGQYTADPSSSDPADRQR